MNNRKILISLLSVMIIVSFTMAVSSCSSGGGKGATGSESKEETKTMSYEISDVVFVQKEDGLGDKYFYGIVEITNTGDCGIYMKDCSFDLEDDDGHLLQTEKYTSHCPDVIAPGQKGYFYNGYGSIDDSVSLDNGIRLVPNVNLIEATGSDEEMYSEYEVTDTDLREGDYWGPKVTGRVTNNLSEGETLVNVYVIFYDNDGKVLSIGGTYIDDLPAGSTQSFEYEGMFSSSVDFDDIADYTVICRPEYHQYR